jgi:hypothetical protein
MSALQGNRGVSAARKSSTSGSRTEEAGDNLEGEDNRGGEAGGSRQRAEGGYRSKRRSVGCRVIQGLLLLVLGTAAGTETGGSWGTRAAAGVEGRRWGHSRGSGCWREDTWQQSGAGIGDSWQQARGAGAGGSKHQPRGAGTGGSWQQFEGAGGDSWQQAGDPAAAGSRHHVEDGVAGGCRQQVEGAVAGGNRHQAKEGVVGGSWQANGAMAGGSCQQARGVVTGGCWRGTSVDEDIDGANSCGATRRADALGGSTKGAARGCGQGTVVVVSEGVASGSQH